MKNLFNTDYVKKELLIAFDDGTTLDNSDIMEESLELIEALCEEEQLRFGSCVASSIRLRLINLMLTHAGKMFSIGIRLNNNLEPFQLGEYKINSDKPTADRRYRDIVAYDAMYDIINADVAEWYNTILPDEKSAVTLKVFRTRFLAYFGIEQEEVTLINDDMLVTRTVAPVQLSGKTVITAICEINGCFGHIGRDGKFQYIFLKEMKEGLYPSDTLYPRDDLYPADPMNAEQISRNHYISATYEDFTTAKINKLQIRQEENDIGYIYGDGDNCYIVQDNFLVYGKSTEELKTIATNLYSIICKVWYRPAHVEAKGNPCLAVGDGIKLRTTYEIVYTYILQRTLKGIQALRDTYDAEGEQYQREEVNSTHEQIIQLKGKTNKLTRTLEETRSEIVDMEAELSTQISQNARDILIQAQQGEEMQAQIALNAQQILLKVNKDSIISEINLAPGTVKIAAPKIDLVGLVEADELVSKFATITTLNAVKAELNELIAKRATIEQLNAVSATVNSINADYASIGELEVQKVRIDSIESSYIKADTVSATYATIYSVTSVNTRIDNLMNDHMQVSGYFGLVGSFTFKNVSVEWGTLPTGQKVLMAVEDE